MQKLQKHLNVAIILAETSHIFCCVLPTVVSVMSLLVGVGLIGALPVSMLVVHDFLHVWELPIIIASGILIALGWCVLIQSRKVDCHDTGCGHEPCTPKKRRSSRLLEIATILFVINVTVYAVFHKSMRIEVPHAPQVQVHEGHGH